VVEAQLLAQPGGFLDGLAEVDGVLWVADVNGDRLMRVRVPSGDQLPPVVSVGGPISVVADGSTLWVAHFNASDVTR